MTRPPDTEHILIKGKSPVVHAYPGCIKIGILPLPDTGAQVSNEASGITIIPRLSPFKKTESSC